MDTLIDTTLKCLVNKMNYITNEMNVILKLSRLNKEEGNTLINSFTTLSEIFKKKVLENINTRAYSLEYSIKSSNTDIQIKKIIGIKGCYLKKTTNNCNLDMLWYDKSNKEFILYGDYKGIIGAINKITYRIKKFHN